MQLVKKGRFLIWSGEATEYQTATFPAVNLSMFQYLIIKTGEGNENMLIPIEGNGKYYGSINTYSDSRIYIKSLLISIVGDHFYIESAKEKIVGINTTGNIQAFKIFKIWGIC